MLNSNGFYDSSILRFALHFSNPDYENMPYFSVCSSQNFLFEAVDFLLCLQMQVVHSKNTYYQLSDAQLLVIHMHCMTTSVRPVAHEGIFSPP
jgi:hypothetical protein